MPYGVCRVCGCTDNDPCLNPEYGNCWWVDDTHELCSHCADETIANDPATQHCINSKGIDPTLALSVRILRLSAVRFLMKMVTCAMIVRIIIAPVFLLVNVI